MRLPVLGAATLLLRLSNAVFSDEAWNVDYHHALLGLPKEETTFLHQPNPDSKASLIYTLSQQGVLGAVNPKDGLLVWRQPLSLHSGAPNSTFLRANGDVVVSGTDTQVAAWSAADGRSAWSLRVDGKLTDVEILDPSAATVTAGPKDAIILTSGDHASVQRLDGHSGSAKWIYSIESGDVPFQVSSSSTQVYAVLLHKTMLGYIKIKVIILDPASGQKIDEYTLSSDSEVASSDSIISVGANSASPIIAWTDAIHSVLKVNVIGAKAVSSFNIDKLDGHDVIRVRLVAPYYHRTHAHFLVHYETSGSHWAEVFHVNREKGNVNKIYQLPEITGHGAFSSSTFGAFVYFTRITNSEITTVSSGSSQLLGSWTIDNLGISSLAGETSNPVHIVSEVSIKENAVSAQRSAVLLSTGVWVLLRDGSPIWQRPEALASTRSAVFAVPSEVEDFAHELDVEAHSSPVHAYLHRLKRHLRDLQQLPEVMGSLPSRFMKGFLGTTADGDATKDTFGFHQLIACATAEGRVIALDAADSTRILWNRKIASLEPGQSWDPQIKSATGGILVLQHVVNGEQIKLNATNGKDITDSQPLESESGASAARNIRFSLQNGQLEAVTSNSKEQLWHFVPPTSERIVSLVARPVNDPVASIGKVLGDRRVLYKYLSPNLALLVTAQDASSTTSIYVLDTVSGATLFSSIHAGVDLQAPISSIVSENWFAYSYTSVPSEDLPKGHHLVVGEMFESLVPNDRGLLSSQSNYSSLTTDAQPFVLTKTYQIPEAISRMTVTQTRQGITSRQLLAVLADSNSIVGIPYPVLDPRRPVGRDPTKDEQMEGLVRYAPTIEFDPKWYLNHQREIVGVKNVITSPALIESTSLVFAYGLDIFGTRLSPSFSFDILGKDFNKFQMLATVAALAVATFVVAPLVTRKQVNTRWQFA